MRLLFNRVLAVITEGYFIALVIGVSALGFYGNAAMTAVRERGGILVGLDQKVQAHYSVGHDAERLLSIYAMGKTEESLSDADVQKAVSNLVASGPARELKQDALDLMDVEPKRYYDIVLAEHAITTGNTQLDRDAVLYWLDDLARHSRYELMTDALVARGNVTVEFWSSPAGMIWMSMVGFAFFSIGVGAGLIAGKRKSSIGAV